MQGGCQMAETVEGHLEAKISTSQLAAVIMVNRHLNNVDRLETLETTDHELHNSISKVNTWYQSML